MAMRHPNIITLHEVCLRKSKVYLIMELAIDGDLFTFINKNGPLPEWRAREYFTQMVDAVLYCHAQGVYHRDLKPENLLLTDALQRLTIADFGFAAMVDKLSIVHPLLRTNCGSPHYCAPEVWNGEAPNGYDGAKADAFSCGVILYCMLVGAQPFDGSCDDVVLASTNECCVHIPDSLPWRARHLIQSLLQRNPRNRSTLVMARTHPWLTTVYGPSPQSRFDTLQSSVSNTVFTYPQSQFESLPVLFKSLTSRVSQRETTGSKQKCHQKHSSPCTTYSSLDSLNNH